MRRIPLVWFLLLRRPRVIVDNLERLHAAGHIPAEPTLFQVFLGVLYMLHRVVFRSDTIGLGDAPVRDNWRARALQYRIIRFPFVSWHRVINPFDLVGLGSTPAYLTRHLLGAYHPSDHGIYDLSILSVHEGAIEALRERVVDVCDGADPFLPDLCVYEGYHPHLLTVIDRFQAGDHATRDEDGPESDATLPGFIAWMLAQPPDLASATREWVFRGGRSRRSDRPRPGWQPTRSRQSPPPR